MAAVIVVVFNEPLDPKKQISSIVLRMKVNILIFYRLPKALNPDVVLAAASTVHADPHLWMSCAGLFPFFAGVLAPLVRIENLRLSVSGNCVLNHLNAACRVKSVVEAPAHDEPAINIYYGYQIHEAPTHRNIGDIRAPHLVRVVYYQAPEQVWFHIHRLAEDAQRTLAVYRLNPHQPHKAAHSPVSDLVANLLQVIRHADHSLRWILKMLLVHLRHHPKVLLALALRLVVMRRPAESQNLALLADADLALRGYQSSAGISIPNFLDTRFAKSSCISKSPILRKYRSFCFSNATYSGAYPPSLMRLESSVLN